MKVVIIGGVLSVAIAVIVIAMLSQINQPTQIQVSKDFLDSLLMMNETERLLMFTDLTLEQEATIKLQEEYCQSLAIDNNHTAISQYMACSNNVGEQMGQFHEYNLRGILAVVNQTIALSEYTYTQTQMDYINQIYRDCLWNEISYYYFITDKMVETCRNEIQSFMREG